MAPPSTHPRKGKERGKGKGEGGEKGGGVDREGGEERREELKDVAVS